MSWIKSIGGEIKHIKAGRREIRNFSVLAGLIILAAASFKLMRGSVAGVFLAAAGAVLIIMGLLAPKVLHPAYKGWMIGATVFGMMATRVILMLLFFLVITPFAFLLRLFGKQFLDLGRNPHPPTYWEKHRQPANGIMSYEQQF